MGTEKQRRQLMKTILATVRTAGSEGLDLNYLIAEISISEGLTRRKALEYIETLKAGRRIEQKEGKLFFLELKTEE